MKLIDMAAGVPICGFTGINGAGKTTLAVESALARMERGRTVYSTVEIKSEWGNSKPILSLEQLLTIEDATLLFDDVAVIFSSRSTSSLPSPVVTLLQTLRHKNLDVIWTAPAWMRCDNLLREVTQGLVNVIPLLRKHERDNPWPRPRLIMAGLLDTSTGVVDATPTKILRRRVYLPRLLHSWGTFDSQADTPMLGRPLQLGVCISCYGTQDRPKHSRARHDALGIPFYDTDPFGRLQSEVLADPGLAERPSSGRLNSRGRGPVGFHDSASDAAPNDRVAHPNNQHDRHRGTEHADPKHEHQGSEVDHLAHGTSSNLDRLSPDRGTE
jgi:hypothetical protein